MTVVTFFTDYAAVKKTEGDYELAKLADVIGQTTADAKQQLPWLKFARFGNERSDRNSLRHDANVLAITGIEADYDGEKVSFFEGCEAIKKAGVKALLYTSPSHHIDKPRWRVVCPTSKKLPPSDRYKMVARVNGILGGILAPESFTLSQSYYYGSIKRNPHHRVQVTGGQYIDLLDELDAGAIGKSNGSTSAGGDRYTEYGKRGSIDEAALLQEIINGERYHTACTSLVGKWAVTGVAYLDALTQLHAAFDQVADDKRDARWRQRRNQDVPKIIRDIYGKEARKVDEQERTADEAPDKVGEGPVTLDDFYAFLPKHTYIYTSCALAKGECQCADKQSRQCEGVDMAGPQPRGSANDLGAGRAADHQGPIALRRGRLVTQARGHDL